MAIVSIHSLLLSYPFLPSVSGLPMKRSWSMQSNPHPGNTVVPHDPCQLQLPYSAQHRVNVHGSAQPLSRNPCSLTTAPKHYTKGKMQVLGCFQTSFTRLSPMQLSQKAAPQPSPWAPHWSNSTEPPGLLKQRYPLCYQKPYTSRKSESYGNWDLSNPNHLHPQQKLDDLKEVLWGLNLSQVI